MSGPLPDTKIRALYLRYKSLNQAADAHWPENPEAAKAEMEERFYREREAIENEIMALPSTCLADFAAKLIVNTCEGSLLTPWETGALWAEARELVGA